MILFANTNLLIDSEEESSCPSSSAASNLTDIVPEERARPSARGTPRPARHTDSEEGWTTTDRAADISLFSGQSRICNVVSLDQNSAPVEFFSYFVTDSMMKHIKEETNLYAQQCIRKLRSTNSLSPTCSLSKWKGVTLMEIRKFLAIVVHMCVSVRTHIREHWSKNPVVSCNFCPNVLSHDRFLSILRNSHISDNSLAKRKGETGYDPLHKVRPLLDNVCANFQCPYTPSQNITIDEGMCKF